MLYSYCFDCRNAKDGSRRQMWSSAQNQDSFFVSLVHFQNEYKGFVIESIKLLAWDDVGGKEIVLGKLEMPQFTDEAGVGPEMLGWSQGFAQGFVQGRQDAGVDCNSCGKSDV